jgi:hypothetical protein
MAFTAARIKYKLQSGHGEGKYVIRNCIVGICSTLSRPKRSFYLIRPRRARFCSAGVAKTTILLPFCARKGETQNIDFRICDVWHKRLDGKVFVV